MGAEVPGPRTSSAHAFPQLLPLDGELVLAPGAAFSAAEVGSDPACGSGEEGEGAGLGAGLEWAWLSRAGRGAQCAAWTGAGFGFP